MFDTHCHLNFSAFDKILDETIFEAKKTGVEKIVVPGTDITTSKKAVKIAEKYDGVYAAIGIHPHHIKEIQNLKSQSKDKILKLKINQIEKLLNQPKIVAIGEIGLDKYIYQKTKYKDYQIDKEFLYLQKKFFLEQFKLAKKYKKAAIIHNREAKNDLLKVLTSNSQLVTSNRIVFHCCEPDFDLLDFAKKYHIYIGVDGDVTYDQKKQEFVKKIPLSLLVLETDSPFLTPAPLCDNKKTKFPNRPKNLYLIAKKIAEIKKKKIEEIIKITKRNGGKLFMIR